MSGFIALGVVTSVFSSLCQSIGLTLQRKSHLIEDERSSARRPWRRRRWIIGMAMFIVANVLGSSVQITTLPLVILSPLQASGLVFNSICATIILAEPFTKLSIIGTVFVSGGAAFIALFGALPEPTHNLRDLLWLLNRKPFIAWMIFQAVLVVAVVAVSRIMRSRKSTRARLGRGIALGSVSGILSAHSLLVAKSAVELLLSTFVGVGKKNQFDRWESWIVLFALLTLALSQLYYLHLGLKLVSTSILYPLVFCVYNITSILNGLIYYRQASRLSAMQIGLVVLGTVLLLGGVFALSYRFSHDTSTVEHRQSLLSPGLGVIEESPCPSPVSDVLPEGSAASTRRHTRRISAADEIWGELQDRDELAPLLERNRSVSSSRQPSAPHKPSSLPKKWVTWWKGGSKAKADDT